MGRRRNRDRPQPPSPEGDPWQHPAGRIRLGVDTATQQPFDLQAIPAPGRPSEIAQHVFLPGASGSGKTTTIARLCGGALACGHAVIIIDCKGAGLGGAARQLAAQHGAPFHLVDPDALDDPRACGYDPCTGDASGITNKLVGAFSYAGAAEIYKHAAMHVLPVLVRALHAVGERVTLDALSESLDRDGMAELGRRAGQPYRDLLTGLARQGGVAADAYIGLRLRFGALLNGKFGPLFSHQPALDWRTFLSEPSVTYVALSVTAAGEDVELMGRVIAQDLKQLCADRLRLLEGGGQLVPVLGVWDEFAALREVDQIVDLLLQARQARMPTVVATQYLPEPVPVREACLGAGLLIAHRVTATAAEALASEFGTRSVQEATLQFDRGSGYAEKGSVRSVEQFAVHPNELRTLPPGQAAIRSVARRGEAHTVQVYREPALP